MTNYTELVVDTSGQDNAYRAPDEIRNFARDQWLREFEKAGLTFIAGEGKDHRLAEGQYLVYLFVGNDEYWYYVIYDTNQQKVVTEKRSKATKREE